MELYASSYISGLNEIVEQELNKMPNVKIIDNLDGMVIYQSNNPLGGGYTI